MNAPIRLRLPIPPSLNSAYANLPGRGRIASRELKDWKMVAGWRLLEQYPARIKGSYRFAIYLPEKMHGDLSNRIKAAEDLLVTHGVTPDDRLAWFVSAERNAEILPDECIIEVSPA